MIYHQMTDLLEIDVMVRKQGDIKNEDIKGKMILDVRALSGIFSTENPEKCGIFMGGHMLNAIGKYDELADILNLSRVGMVKKSRLIEGFIENNNEVIKKHLGDGDSE